MTVSISAPRAEAIDAGRKRSMSGMINCDRFSDVTFVVETRKVFGHRAILAAYSDYLDKQFCGPYLDSNGTVPIEGIRYEPFVNVVLTYIYTGELTVPEDEDLMSVLEHADRWQLENLLKFVVAHICEASHLDGHICIQALNFSKHHCNFDGLEIEPNTQELWKTMYQECLKYFEKHGTDIIKNDPSVLTHIESHDLMYIVLSKINLESMASRTLLELGRVFFLWLKSDCGGGSPVDTLFEVLAHMKTMSDIEQGSKVTKTLKISVLDIASPSWRCPSDVLTVPSFRNHIHVQKSKTGKHLGVFFTQKTDCEFMNQWPLRTTIQMHLEPTARRTSRAAKHFNCEFTKQWRDRDQGQGFPEFAALSELKADGKYVHDGFVHMHVNMQFEPHPVFKLCMLFASCGFQQIRHHPQLSLVDTSLLKNILTCDRLDAASEAEVLEVVTSHVSHYPSLLASMLDCVRFAYVPVAAVVQAFRSSAVLRNSDHFKKQVIASLRSTDDGIVCGRGSYKDDEVQLTIDSLVELLLCGNPVSCVSNAIEAEDHIEELIPDLCPCQCATHEHAECASTSSSTCETKLEELEELEDPFQKLELAFGGSLEEDEEDEEVLSV